MKKFCSIILYADDTALVKKSNNFNLLCCYMNFVLYKLSEWCNYNNLLLNTKKTKIMLVTNKYVSTYPNIALHNNNLEWVKTFTYLGVIFDCKMTMAHHILYLKSKLSAMCGITHRITKYLDERAAKSFFYSMVFSAVSYCISVWGGNLQKKTYFDSINNAYVRCICNLFHCKRENINEVYKKYSILKLDDVYNYFLSLAIYKSLNFNTLPFLNVYLNANYVNANNNTRGGNRYYVPFPRVNTTLYGFLFNAVKCCNTIPAEYFNYSKTKFKSTLKSKLLKSY